MTTEIRGELDIFDNSYAELKAACPQTKKNMEVEGQLNSDERRLLTEAIRAASNEITTVLEVGTWLGGGSTLHILRALHENNNGHLWGIEADQSIYRRMIANIQAAAPEAIDRFTPLFGRSQRVIPKWLAEMGHGLQIDLAFLDGGDNPAEQITEFQLIDPYMAVGAILMAHDAKLRKGKWLVPYISKLDNWKSKLHDVSAEGLFFAKKIAPHPSEESLRRARRHLLKMRFEPAELAAAILPAKLRALALSLLPKKLRRRVTEGR
jgi:predicted O-methyltransferase YrrM